MDNVTEDSLTRLCNRQRLLLDEECELIKRLTEQRACLLEALKDIHDSPCAQERIYRGSKSGVPCTSCAAIANAEGQDAR